MDLFYLVYKKDNKKLIAKNIANFLKTFSFHYVLGVKISGRKNETIFKK